MEQNHLENFLILLLAMGSSLPIELIAASSQIFAADKSTRKVATESELITALADSTLTEIILDTDLIVLSTLHLNRREPLVLNLNHYKIASLAAESAIEIHAGGLLITGNGSIVANGKRAAGIRLHGALTADNANYSNLSVGPEVVIYAPEFYGIQIVAQGNAAYGVTVDFSGKIIAHDGIGIQNAVTGSGKNAAKIIVNAPAEIEADTETGVALGALGFGVWQINQGQFVAATSVQYRSGELTFYGGHFAARHANQISPFLAPGHQLDLESQRDYATVIGPQREVIIDPVVKFQHEQEKLEALILRAEKYIKIIRSGEGLGEWQDAATKATTSVKRSVTAANKLLSAKSVVLEQIVKAEQRLQNSMQGIEKVEDDLRTEIFSVLAMAEELDPREYSEYSYNLLAEAMQAAEVFLKNPRTTLDELYSALCDINLNLDLLEEPEEVPLDAASTIDLPVAPEMDLPVTEPAPALPVVEPIVPAEPIIEQPSEAEILTWIDLGSAAILSTIDDLTAQFAAEEDATLPVDPVTDAEASLFIEPAVTEPTFTESIPQPTEDTAVSTALLEAHDSLRMMLEAVQDLKLSDYRAEFVEQFGELQVAIVKAQAILGKPEATLPEILDTMDEMKFATTGLNLEAPAATEKATQPEVESPVAAPENASVQPPQPVQAIETPAPASPDWSALQELVAQIAPLEATDYTTESYQRMLTTLERAKVLLANPQATQSDINDLVFDLNLALLGLERVVQAPVSSQFVQPLSSAQPTPNLFSSIAAGVSSGLTTYRKSRIITKRRKLLRKAQSLSKLA